MKRFIYFYLSLSLFPLLYAQGAQAQTIAAAQKGEAPERVFEMAALLAISGKYDDAYAYFQYVLRDTQTRQLYNNAGVVAVLGALQYFRPKEREVRFHYPLELELQSRASRDTKGFIDTRKRLLREAISYFEAAIQLDTGYAPAYLNKACAFALLGDALQAKTEAERATQKPGYEKTATDALVLFGILHALQGDSLKALASFKAGAAKGNAVAEYNRKTLQKEEIQKPVPFNIFGGIETIDNMSLIDSYNIPLPDPNTKIDVDTKISFYQNLRPGPDSYFYFSDNAGSGQKIYYLLTGPDYKGQTVKKLKLGATQADIVEAYGTPTRVLETPNGQIWAYASIFFMLGTDGVLTRWAIYGEDN